LRLAQLQAKEDFSVASRLRADILVGIILLTGSIALADRLRGHIRVS
jgi:hypothetical protein